MGGLPKKSPAFMTDHVGRPLALGVACRSPKPTGVRGAFRLRFPQRLGPLVTGLVGEEVVCKDLGTFRMFVN